jgi:hypothetical protein
VHAALELAKKCELVFGPGKAARSSWVTVVEILCRTGNRDIAKLVEGVKCEGQTGRINLEELAGKIVPSKNGESVNPAQVDEVVEELMKPYYVWTKSGGYYKLGTKAAVQFVQIYTALRNDQKNLYELWKRLEGSKFGLEDPSAYDIVQIAINTVHSISEYMSLSKRVHANQFIGCSLIKSLRYRDAARQFWASLVERLYKTSVYFFNTAQFESHKTVSTSEEPGTGDTGDTGDTGYTDDTGDTDDTGNRRDREQSHDNFIRDVCKLVADLVEVINELDQNPQPGTEPIPLKHGSRIDHKLSAKCSEKLENIRIMVQKISDNEGPDPKKYKRSQQGPRDAKKLRRMYELAEWLRRGLDEAATPGTL